MSDRLLRRIIEKMQISDGEKSSSDIFDFKVKNAMGDVTSLEE